MASFQLENLFNVKGKVVLVTGGSRGIGKMIATGFIRNGCKVYISSRTAKECEATAKELTKMGPGQCIAISCNLLKYEEAQRLVESLKSREKVLHVLVNNAGTTWGEDVDTHPDSAFTKVLTLNVQRIFTLTQLCLPLLREAAVQGGMEGACFKDPARIINIGSIEAEQVPPHHTYSYATSKAALHHLSRHLAGRLGLDGITSNSLACGAFPSKMMAYTLETMGEIIKASNPLHRIGTPEDIVGATLFLASRGGAYVNGATIALDGGQMVSMSARL